MKMKQTAISNIAYAAMVQNASIVVPKVMVRKIGLKESILLCFLVQTDDIKEVDAKLATVSNVERFTTLNPDEQEFSFKKLIQKGLLSEESKMKSIKRESNPKEKYFDYELRYDEILKTFEG